jgi:hypothetical protein
MIIHFSEMVRATLARVARYPSEQIMNFCGNCVSRAMNLERFLNLDRALYQCFTSVRHFGTVLA